MGWFLDALLHVFWPALELQLHGLTPLALVSAMTFGNITLSFLVGIHICTAPAVGPQHTLRDVAMLWGMGCASILIWLAAVISLHSAGLS